MKNTEVSYQIYWRLKGSPSHYGWFPYYKRLKTRSYCEKKIKQFRSSKPIFEFKLVSFSQDSLICHEF